MTILLIHKISILKNFFDKWHLPTYPYIRKFFQDKVLDQRAAPKSQASTAKTEFRKVIINKFQAK